MQCPACFNHLSTMQVGSVAVDVCQGGCGGIWFDAFELQRVDDREEPAGEGMLEIHKHPGVQVDFARKRSCPKCDGIKLKKRFFSARRTIEIDECPSCGGYWLDAGELARIREEKQEQVHAAQLQPALSTAEIRYLYRLRTGQS